MTQEIHKRFTEELNKTKQHKGSIKISYFDDYEKEGAYFTISTSNLDNVKFYDDYLIYTIPKEVSTKEKEILAKVPVLSIEAGSAVYFYRFLSKIEFNYSS